MNQSLTLFLSLSLFVSLCLTHNHSLTHTFLRSPFPSSPSPSLPHRRAWGIMSTASRIGIMLVTITVSLRDNVWSPLAHEHVDNGEAVQATFLACAIIMLCWALLLTFTLRNEPPSRSIADPQEHRHSQPPLDKPPDGQTQEQPRAQREDSVLRELHKDGIEASGVRSWSAFANELTTTMSKPMFICALVGQSMATPLAEFQSQVLSLPLARSRSLVFCLSNSCSHMFRFHLHSRAHSLTLSRRAHSNKLYCSIEFIKTHFDNEE